MKGGVKVFNLLGLSASVPDSISSSSTAITSVQALFGLITSLIVIVVANWPFLVSLFMKIGGKVIGWVKSLMGTGGRRRR